MPETIYKNDQTIEMPTVVIKHRNYDNIGSVSVTDMVYTNHFNSPNELSFTVHATDEKGLVWDKINDYNIVFLPEYGEYFDMQVEKTEENVVTKKVTCRSLCESELSQIRLYDIEINTDADIARPDYNPDFPTIFYRENDKSSSLLHRILDKAPHYSIGHVDDSLKNLKSWYEFHISDTTIYDALMGEISEMYKCLFTFDAATRTINAYDLCNTCRCGYRGEFDGSCPKCRRADFSGAYGKDTSIYISRDNLAKSATIKSNKESLKNCFHVSGGDDVITDAVVNLNPAGNNYIYYFSPETKAEMPKDLVAKIEEYNNVYNYSYNDKFFPMPDLTDYNALINQINQVFSKEDASGNREDKFHPIKTQVKDGKPGISGYKNAMKYLYEATDLAYFLQSSMFPTIVTEQETLEDTLRKLTVQNLGPIGVSNADNPICSSVDRAVENYCRVYVNTALYKISTENTSILEDKDDKLWHGTIKLTEIADKEHSGQVTLTLALTSELEDFLKQKLERELAKADNYARPITDMDITEDEFARRLTLYNMDYLSSIKISFQDCLQIIEDLRAEKGDSISQELYDKFYNPYFRRIKCIDYEMEKRQRQIQTVNTVSEHLESIKKTERTDLDFQAFLGKELWKTFCSYRREDSYKNDNYVSNGLSDSEIITKTEELLDAAKQELFKAGNMQFEVSADINNLLALPEFCDFAKDFKVGNWIHLMVDENIYHLRLLSYQITFDDLVSISVEFSTLTKTANGVSDFNSVIQTTSSLASSYSSFKQQMNHTISASAQVNDWMQNGLDATATRLVNDARTQELIIDSGGILCRAYDDIEDNYDGCQLKISRNLLSLTDDNWKNTRIVIGKYRSTEPETGRELSGYGVMADAIVGKLVLNRNLGICNGDLSLQLDENGLTVKNDSNTIMINPNDPWLFRISRPGEAVPSYDDILYCDEDGQLHMTGIIEATDGSFHGTVEATDGSFHGTVEATDGSFHGAIHATDGNLYTDKLQSQEGEILLNYEKEGKKLSIGNKDCPMLALHGACAALTSAPGITVRSDERLHHSSKPLDEFDEVFLDLEPCAFKPGNADSLKFHFGFGAKQIEDALLSHGFTTDDFGGLVQLTDDPDDEDYCGCENPLGLVYTEFTSWNTHMIQKLFKEIETLKQRIQELEDKMA